MLEKSIFVRACIIDHVEGTLWKDQGNLVFLLEFIHGMG